MTTILLLALTTLVIILVSNEIRVLFNVKKTFYEQGFERSGVSTNARITPGKGYRVIGAINLKKDNQNFVVFVTAKGWIIIRELSVSNLIKVDKDGGFMDLEKHES